MEMKKKSIFAATAVLALFAFIAWLCGYNFDHRGPEVAYYFVVSCCIAFLTAISVGGPL
jgi:hypothetical protein